MFSYQFDRLASKAIVWVTLPIYDLGTACAVGPGTIIQDIGIFCSWGG